MSFEKRESHPSIESSTINFPGFGELPLEAREEFIKLFKESLEEDGYMLKYAMEQGEMVLTVIVPEVAE